MLNTGIALMIGFLLGVATMMLLDNAFLDCKPIYHIERVKSGV